MIIDFYNKLLSESITSDLKKKHSNKEWFSITIAPTSKTKYYKQILVFYSETDYIKEEHEIGVWFKDAQVYALKYKTDDYDDLGYFDEFFYSSSTYCAMLKDKKLSILNCVSNVKTNIGEFNTIDSEMRSKLRADSAAIARGKFSIKASNTELKDIKVIGKASGYVLYEKDGKQSLFTRDEKQILPWIKNLKVGFINNKFISAKVGEQFKLFSINGKEIVSGDNMFLLYKSYAITDEYKTFYFYNENGYVGFIENIKNLLEIIRNSGSVPNINLYTYSYEKIFLRLFGVIDLKESDTLIYLKDKNYFLKNIINFTANRIFEMIFELDTSEKEMLSIINKINLSKAKSFLE